MAEEKSPPPVKKPAVSPRQESESVPVLVEMRVERGQTAAQSMQMAGGLNITGLQVDNTYEPVPLQAPPDEAAQFEAERKEIVLIRGIIEESRIPEIEAQENVVKVHRDTPIEPFGINLEEEVEAEADFVQLAPNAAFGTCPIPPCDCSPGTAKGAIPDVARYLGVDQIWAAGRKGQGIVIGIVDGGISAAGRVTGGTIPRVIGGWPTANWGTRADWGRHGNMTATDALGMAPQAHVYDIRISDGNAISSALSGFQWAINQHRANGTPHILSNSWGIYQESWDRNYARNPNHPFTRKVVEALNQGILVLFAAGNCGEACPSGRCGGDAGPGKSIWGANGHPRVMTVGAANTNGQLVGYSSQGPAALDPNKPDFCSISHFRGYFASDTGTSAACPVAAGVVALLKQCKADLTQEAAKEALKGTARNIGPSGWDKHSGSGIIQAKAAYDKLCGPGGGKKCDAYRTKASQYLAAYKKTKNRKYLCQYYRYLALYYRCRFQQTKDRRYLCRYYFYWAKYYQCLHGVTKNRKYLCAYYREWAAYHCCMYQVTKKRAYLCRCYYYRALYYRCLYAITKKASYLRFYKKYFDLYKRCVKK
ncbi:MAG: S8 family serine peptidase [Nitrospira sp.]|nr:S8 family serine peptidase [Nitrospira sp.]